MQKVPLDRLGVRVVRGDIVSQTVGRVNHYGKVTSAEDDVICVFHRGCVGKALDPDGCQLNDFYLADKWVVLR